MKFGFAMSVVIATIAAQSPPPLQAHELLPGVHFVPGRFVPGMQPDGNTVGFEAPEGLVVIDTGRHAEHVQDVLDLAGEVQSPIIAVINTHWHLDHVGGNPVIRRAFPDAEILASGALEGAMNGFLKDYRTYLEGAVAAADSAGQVPLRAELAILDAGPELEPDEEITHGGFRYIAGKRFELGLTDHAVTAADVWVYDPATRVLVAGDLVTLPVPFLDTACPRGWQAALWRLSTVDFRLLVPGHGPPMGRKEFETWRNAFENLLASARTGSVSRDELIARWIRDCGSLVPPADRETARTMLGYYIDTALRGDPAVRARYCGE